MLPQVHVFFYITQPIYILSAFIINFLWVFLTSVVRTMVMKNINKNLVLRK